MSEQEISSNTNSGWDQSYSPSEREKQLVVDNILTFLCNKIQVVPRNKLIEIVNKHLLFTDDMIRNSREVLWAHCAPDSCGFKREGLSIRKDNIEDMMNLLSLLSTTRMSVKFVSDDINLLPLIPQDEMNELDIASLFDSIAGLQADLSSVVSTLLPMQEKIFELGRKVTSVKKNSVTKGAPEQYCEENEPDGVTNSRKVLKPNVQETAIAIAAEINHLHHKQQQDDGKDVEITDAKQDPVQSPSSSTSIHDAVTVPRLLKSHQLMKVKRARKIASLQPDFSKVKSRFYQDLSQVC